MTTKTIENLFSDKTLVIPGFQRDYAWRERNINDLFGDIEEALETGGGHYLGTFILSQPANDRAAPAQVVDGQQRLTTLTLILKCLIDSISDTGIRHHYHSTFIVHPVTGPKFRVLGVNEEFFSALLADQDPAPASDGQERLRDAYRWVKQRVQALQTRGGQELLTRWLLCASRMEVLEFIERDEGRAIRMFQSVNDRGVPLSRMDIVKSLLIYYSNRYLGGVLDHSVAEQFGEAFRSFSRIKKLGSENGYKVRNIDRDAFREDDILRYHYFAFDARPFGGLAGADFNATSETVLEAFLKPTLQRLRSDRASLQQFIASYTADLGAFFSGLERLMLDARSNRSTYMLFCVQDLAATLYPLTIRLHLLTWLTQPVTTDARTLQELVELVDLRVFKVRGTNPQVHIFRITRELPEMTPADVARELADFCQRFMSDSLLRSRLVDQELYRNLGLTRILVEEEDRARAAVGLKPLQILELAELAHDGLTAEHILAQAPAVNLAAYGFGSQEAFEEVEHKLGNLVLLEGAVNSRCSNRSVDDKMTAPNLYMSSELEAVKALAAHYAGQASFSRGDIDKRGQNLAAMVLDRWRLFNAVEPASTGEHIPAIQTREPSPAQGTGWTGTGMGETGKGETPT